MSMDEDLIRARILSRMQDGLPIEEILDETIKDCGGDEERAKALILEEGNRLLGVC